MLATFYYFSDILNIQMILKSSQVYNRIVGFLI